MTIDSGTFTYDALDRRLDFGASGSYQQYFYPPFDLNYNFGQAVGSAGQLGLRVPTPGGGQVNMTPSGVSAYRHPNWQGSQVVNSTTTRTAAADNAFTPFGEHRGKALPPQRLHQSFKGNRIATRTGTLRRMD